MNGVRRHGYDYDGFGSRYGIAMGNDQGLGYTKAGDYEYEFTE